MKKSLALLLLFILMTGNVYCLEPAINEDSTKIPAERPLRKYTTTRLTTEKPVIDGLLDDACWKTGTWAGDFVQWVPSEGAEPSQPTELKILYDDANIYVAIRAFDSEPDKIVRKAGRRDEFAGDVVGVNFDSYHDHRTGFEFNITAAGQKVDVLLTNPTNGDFSWNAVWYAKAGMEDSAWVAEFEIPLSQLRYSSDYEQVWGMHCWRWIDRLQEESDWEYQTSQGPGMLYLFGELHGIKGLPASQRIEIVPYSLGKLKTFHKEPLNPYANDGRTWLGNLGIDAKIGISSNFTADLTINPDFGQVESDPSVMNLSAYETFYEEKRPFFLEGKNIFNFDFDGVNLFYSRRIGHTPGYKPDLEDDEYIDFPDNTTILSAVKFSGKTADGLAVGVLQSLTAKEKSKFNSSGNESEISVEPLTNYAIVRVQQDFEEGNTVLGGILTSTNRFINDPDLEFMNRNAFTGGLDFLHHWNDKEFYVEAKVVGSMISGTSEAIRNLQKSSARYYQRPDADYLDFDSTRTNLSGVGGKVIVGKKSKGNWRYSTEINWRSPGLDLNDLGYMPTSDIIKQANSVSYSITQPESIFRTYNVSLTEYNNWDFGMNYLGSGGSLSLYLEFLNKWSVSTSLNYSSEAIDNKFLRGGNSILLPSLLSANVYMKTDPSEKIFFDLTTNLSLTNEKFCRYYSVQPGLSIMPSNILKFSLSLLYSSHDDKLMYIDKKTVNNEDKYILASILQHTLNATIRIDYNITPEFSIQYYGSPFASSGKYYDFKTPNNHHAENYDDRFLRMNTILDGENYNVSENNNGQIDYSFENPDFNFSEFRSNFVVRWEYRPGSQIYFVWSHERSSYEKPGVRTVNGAMSQLKDIFPTNIFLVKFNYWFSI